MALLHTVELLPSTSADVIREFDERYLAGVGAVEADSWAEMFGDVFDVSSPDVTFPIALMSAKYEETKGESRVKSMGEKEIRVKVAEYDGGFEAPLMQLFQNAYMWKKWQQAPARLLLAEKNFILRNIATLLEAGTTGTSPWDDVAFFSAASHLANPEEPSVGTFGNYTATDLDPSDIANIEAEVVKMGAVLDENGEKMGATATHIFLPTALYEPTKNVLTQDLILSGALAGDGDGTMGTISNPYKSLVPVHLPHLTNATRWYLFDANLKSAQAVPPWGAMKYLPPDSLGLRYFDESSDYFKNTGKLKVSSHIWHAFTLLFPHAIRRVGST